MSKTLNLMVVFQCCGKTCKIEKVAESGNEAPKSPEASPQLQALEQGVERVLADLVSIKNTRRSKVLKKLHEHLSKLAVKNSLPEDLRMAELTSGIEQAIAMLDQTKMITRAKRLQRLRQNLADLLEAAGKDHVS